MLLKDETVVISFFVPKDHEKGTPVYSITIPAFLKDKVAVEVTDMNNEEVNLHIGEFTYQKKI